MRLYRVPMLNDYPEFRGQFLFSTMTSTLAFLDAKGHLHLFNSEIEGAILAALMEREVQPAAAREPEFMPKINPPPPPAQVGTIEAYVASIERLARAIRG